MVKKILSKFQPVVWYSSHRDNPFRISANCPALPTVSSAKPLAYLLVLDVAALFLVEEEAYLAMVSIASSANFACKRERSLEEIFKNINMNLRILSRIKEELIFKLLTRTLFLY